MQMQHAKTHFHSSSDFQEHMLKRAPRVEQPDRKDDDNDERDPKRSKESAHASVAAQGVQAPDHASTLYRD